MTVTENWWRSLLGSAPTLILSAMIMLPDIAFCVYGLLTDPTVITGAPAWLKPLKFGISTVIYTISLAVIVRYTTVWRGALRVMEFLTGVALTLEIVIIDVQAARHTTSHFNVSAPLDASLWMTMGASIAVLWLSAVVITIATFRTSYRSPSWTIVARYGMVLAVLGMASGAFMAVPSNAQLQKAEITHRMTTAGSHTIGGVDGGKGLPLLNWSTQHGDVRPAHFVGMHALQVLALLAFLLHRFGVADWRASRILSVAVISYGSLFFLILIEALLKYPLTNHSKSSLIVWAIWLTGSALLFIWASRNGNPNTSALACQDQAIA